MGYVRSNNCSLEHNQVLSTFSCLQWLPALQSPPVYLRGHLKNTYYYWYFDIVFIENDKMNILSGARRNKKKEVLMNLIKKLSLEWLLICVTNFREETFGVDKAFP